MKNEKMVNSTPPPCFLGSKRLCRLLCVFVCAVFAFALVGCGDTKDTETWERCSFDYSTHENINGVDWEVVWQPYRRFVNGELVDEKIELFQIRNTTTTNEKKSKYYDWLAYYHGDSSTYVVHTIELCGTPCGDGWFQIIQTETYKSGWQSYDAEDLAKWQQHYVPGCSLDENGRLVFFTRITRYDEKISVTPYTQINH